MAKELELTWIAKLKQWRKRRKVDGKTRSFYLGTGTGKSDSQSYEKALAKWKAIAQELDRKEQAQRCQEQHAPWHDSLVAQPGDARPPALFSPSELLSLSMDRWLRGIARLGEDRLLPATSAAGRIRKTLCECIDDYLAEQQRRYEHGLKFPNAPQRERISGVRLISYRYNAGLLKAAWRNEPLPEDEASMTRLMKQFRESQKTLLTAGTIQPGTFNERMKTIRHFVGWLHDQYLIPCLPRQTHTLCSLYEVKPTAKALDLETIRRLWQEASPRLKTYMALGLNCGFYAADVANLEYAHIQGDHIVCRRHKTGVPTRFKLWDVTKRLLAENCNGKERLALVTDEGGPLLINDPMANDGKGRRWCKIETELLALKKRLGIEGVTFSRFRDTSSTRIESIDRNLTDLFDGHKDGRMARFYVDGDKIDYDRMFAGLDKATDELEAYYGLTYP